ncbi:hypothetical protein EDB92DRAFT_1884454 [Lactarius akahatsu]|uniref:Uncharacterized protein n=1 Tax=Lactarius akahatsu TaxID=416441 RepID=A0AAD4L8W2_9AGAM|nr:hypothetical protein EDB92DRAFT_1884454 [Lactarius akahatsu]
MLMGSHPLVHKQKVGQSLAVACQLLMLPWLSRSRPTTKKDGTTRFYPFLFLAGPRLRSDATNCTEQSRCRDQQKKKNVFFGRCQARQTVHRTGSYWSNFTRLRPPCPILFSQWPCHIHHNLK